MSSLGITITKVFCPLNVKNLNGRIYTKDILESHVEELLKRKESLGVVFGEYDPDTIDTSLARVSHRVNKIWFENNNLMGEIELINTYYGKYVKSLIDDGIEFVVRPRSMGTIEPNGFVNIKKLFTFDIIPFTKDSFYSIKEERKIKLNILRQKQEEIGILSESYNSSLDIEEDKGHLPILDENFYFIKNN